MSLYRLAKTAWLYARMNKRGVEGLPLKYVIIILVAALVIALAVTMTNTLGWGVKYASNLTNQSVVGNITDALR